jgi:hypothetical protein
MLGITYHNPATITVYLDRMRFKDCFISIAEVRDGEWRRKLKAFTELPRDGRERVLFIESFAGLQTLMQQDAKLQSVKVAVYDDCEILSKVPGAKIVDAHINGSDTDTWQLYTVSFREFNDALASQPDGVPALLRDFDTKEDSDLPEQPIAKPQVMQQEDPELEEKPESKDRSTLVMEQILDDIDAPDEDEEESEAEEAAVLYPDKIPEQAVTAMPEVAKNKVLIKKKEPISAESESALEPEAEPEPEPPVETKPKPEPAKAKAKAKRTKKPKLESYELF